MYIVILRNFQFYVCRYNGVENSLPEMETADNQQENDIKDFEILKISNFSEQDHKT